MKISALLKNQCAIDCFKVNIGSNISRLRNFLNDLNGASLSALAATGFKGYWREHAFGMNISDVRTGEFFSSTENC